MIGYCYWYYPCEHGERYAQQRRQLGMAAAVATQRLQYPLIKEYPLNHIRDPTIIYGIFLNEGILESLGIVWQQQSSS